MIRTKLISIAATACIILGLFCGTAAAEDDASATAVKLNKHDAVVVCKKKLPLLRAQVTPPDKKLKWTSSDKSVATVNSSGVVSGLKAGYAVITVTTEDGASDECKITVLYKDD